MAVQDIEAATIGAGTAPVPEATATDWQDIDTMLAAVGKKEPAPAKVKVDGACQTEMQALIPKSPAPAALQSEKKALASEKKGVTGSQKSASSDYSGSEKPAPLSFTSMAADPSGKWDSWIWKSHDHAVGILAYVAWIAAALFSFAAAGLLILWFADKEGGASAVATFLVLSVAGAAYFAKARHLGYMVISEKQIPLVRYLDWIITTPLMLYELCHVGRAETNVVIMVCGCDLLMLTMGIVAAVVDFSHNCLKHCFFAGSCFFFVLMLMALRIRVSETAAAAPPDVQHLFSQLEWLMIIVWSMYPIVVGAGRAHLGLISSYTEDAILAVLDVSAKIGMEIMVVATCAQPGNGCHASSGSSGGSSGGSYGSGGSSHSSAGSQGSSH